MLRRLRSLAVVSDLQRLGELGLDPAASADAQQAFMLDLYRANALAGQFDHLPLFVDPDKLAVDVGANAGQYALKLACLCPKVLVIEPAPELAWLEQRLPRNCVFRAVAAGDGLGTAVLRTPLRDGQPQSGRATLTAYNGAHEAREVSVQTVDALLDECCPGAAVGFFKIDAEGWSTAVLRGAARTLARWRPNVQVEIWPEHWDETVELLGGWGYRGMFFYDGRLFDLARFDPAVHAAPQHAWDPDRPDAFDPTLYVGDFFFIPVEAA